MKSVAALIIVLLSIGLSGCRNHDWWKKNDQKTQQNSVMSRESDVMRYNDFRTIDASMMEPPEKKDKSLFWENTKAREIERRLGVPQK